MAPGPIPPQLQASVEGTKVDYVRLGKSGLKVSVPILGAMSFGRPDWGSWVLDEEKVSSPSAISRREADDLVPASVEGSVRPRAQHVGHSEHVQQRSVGGDYRQGDQEV
jgi:hypothetical protein